ncbi:GspH/FimT family pseudopilin [Oceanicoccus sp. KOV_DT_Chl]|uniref:GspH/FimT family pseudopilin n=1 Tax=Oceanicoccus sp. KOV_DT_Chl TaxID=1904639 RepID=UPI000C7BE58D|nr:GspH/FimT family pseudopilin [Oceanicoccus sp. KOV_DT_Chl]
MNTSPYFNTGLTLIELISTLSISIILVTVGTGPMSKWLQYQTESTVFNTLFHLTTYARTLAVKENRYLTVCPSLDQRQCGGNWNKTIIVFTDHNKSETVDKNEDLHMVLEMPESTPCLTWNASAKRQYLQFKPSGAANGTAGHFRFCEEAHSALNKKVVISLNGRTSLRSL